MICKTLKNIVRRPGPPFIPVESQAGSEPPGGALLFLFLKIFTDDSGTELIKTL